jgi:gamma-glutamyl phosphate reductase
MQIQKSKLSVDFFWAELNVSEVRVLGIIAMRFESLEIEQVTEKSADICMTSGNSANLESRTSMRLIVTAIAAVSALTGGLATAWYYRKTLSRLQHADFEASDSKFRISHVADDEDL